MKDQYFTAGEFAKLHHVNKRTLHYYDEIGLFQPNRKGENEYRYYSYQQSPEFEMILAFRELGMSIEEIKAYYAERTPENFRRILQDKQHSIQEQIRHLRKIRQMLKVKEAQLNLCEQADFDTIAMIDCETEYLLLSDPMNGDFGSDDFKILFEQMVAAPAGQLLNSRYGSMIDTAQLLQGNFDAYAYFFTQIANPVNKKGLFRKPKGSYLRTFCKGDWSQIPATYERLLAYAEEHRLTLTGYAYEEGINEMVISSIDEYVAQITVRCFASEEVKGAYHSSEKCDPQSS